MRRALVVDDDEGIRFAERMLLEDEGYAVEEAENGREALQRLRQARAPTVVLLDYMMPQMDGGEVLRAVAADPTVATSHAYLLVTAQRTMPLAMANLLTELGVRVLIKPFDVDKFLASVNAAAQRLGITEG